MKHVNTKTTPAILITILIILSVVPLTLIPIRTHAQAPSITVSDKYFNPRKAIAVEVRGDFGPNIRVGIINGVTGEVLAEEDITRVAVGYYVFYLGGPSSHVSFPIGGAPLITINDVSRGTPIRIEVLGTGLAETVYYDIVAPTVTLDRREYPYRRDALVRISYVDPDADHDPTAKDTLFAYCVNVDITLIKADGRVFSTSVNLDDLGAADSKEPTVRGGRFSYEVWISAISSAVGQPIGKDDRVLLSLSTMAECQGGNNWDDPKTTVDFKAVYRYPTVSVTFNQQEIVIDVTSPDDNTNTAAKDNLDPTAYVILTIGDSQVNIDAELFKETGVNTNVFRYTIPVTWGETLSVTSTMIILPRNVDGPFKATVRYYKLDDRPGYSIDATGSGTYTPKLPIITIDKTSVKIIIATVVKPDLNNLPKSIEMLTGAGILTTDKFDIRMDRDGVCLARLRILDKDGNLVGLKTGFNVSHVTMVETDFNTGVFTLKIPTEYINIKAGETYTLEYIDFAGFAAEKVTVTFTVTEIALTLDRSEYPAALGSTITVYVSYSNDLYNKDPTRKETIDIEYKIVGTDGSILDTGTVELEETDVDTGLFKGSGSISVPDDDKAIEGVLVVYDPQRPEAKFEAKLRLYDGKLTVSTTRIKMGGSVTITIEDPDLNRDSGTAESFSLTIRSDRCSYTATFKETGVNTGVFTATITYSKDKFCGAAAAPDKISVSYSDLRQRPLIVGYTRYTAALSTTVTVESTTGTLEIKTAEPGKVSIIEKFTITITDPDANVNVESADDLKVLVVVEGVHLLTPEEITLTETGAKTGVFVKSLYLRDIPGVPTAIKDLAKLIGKKVFIMYADEADTAGVRTIVSATLTIVAYDPELSLSPPVAINIGDELTITVVDKNMAGASRVTVFVKSTVYPIPIPFPAAELEDAPGTFVYKVRVVSPEAWTIGAPEVPARFGDTIEVIYVAPVNSKGETDVILTKSVAVGIRPVMPGETRKVELLSEVGEPITPKVGVLSFITVTVANIDIETHSMTVIVVVRDPNDVAVALYFSTVTLAPGASQPVGFGWMPTVSGKHNIEVYVVRSLADRTPMASPYTASVVVT
ncbi:MAG: hypothetical protein QXQ93_01735 [Ignisphaera sp.]